MTKIIILPVLKDTAATIPALAAPSHQSTRFASVATLPAELTSFRNDAGTEVFSETGNDTAAPTKETKLPRD
jgi:hypothetical protein